MIVLRSLKLRGRGSKVDSWSVLSDITCARSTACHLSVFLDYLRRAMPVIRVERSLLKGARLDLICYIIQIS